MMGVRTMTFSRLLAHRDFRIALAVVLTAGAGLVAWTYRLNRQVALLQQALDAAEAERRSFEGRVEGERRRAEANREDLESRIEHSRQREEELRRRLADAAGGSEVRTLDAELRQVRSRTSRGAKKVVLTCPLGAGLEREGRHLEDGPTRL